MEPAEFKCTISPEPDHMECFTFSLPDGRAVALWRGGLAKDNCEPVSVTLRLPFSCRSAEAYDSINGVKQDLVVTPRDGGLEIRDLLIGDAPLVVRMTGN